MRFGYLILSLSLLVMFSCNKETKYSNIPKIKFLSSSHTSVQAGKDTNIIIRFEFEDGDGNIGFGTKNLILSDSRFNDTIPYEIPKIEERYNPSDGLKGIIQVSYSAAFLFLRNDSTHLESDTLYWNIYMKDQAGNQSNIIRTTDLVLFK
jgi:hypothetical protein